MSTLVIQLPEHRRLRASAGEAEPEDSPRRREYVYVTSEDGIEFEAQGEAVAALLPRRSIVIAVLAETDVSWHRVTLPKAPASKLRAALVGVVEEGLLEDADEVHLAVAPQVEPGKPTWITATDRAFLQSQLELLEKNGVFVDRVVPAAWPDDPPMGHFHTAKSADPTTPGGTLFTWAHADGVFTVRLDGALARAIVPQPPPATTRWTAAPSAAVAAEQWVGAPVTVMPEEERLLQAGRSLWNLRQFELARRTRGSRAFTDWLRQAMSPAWRPVRWGVAAFLAVWIAGLNVWAWHEKSAIEARRAAIEQVVRTTWPKVAEGDLKLDAGAVMLRETQALRTQAGKPGETDLEPMLAAAAAAWPAERPPVENLKFETGKLTIVAAGWTDQQVEQFRGTLKPAGWQVDASEGKLVVTRARVPGNV